MLKFANNAHSEIAAGIDSATTTITLKEGEGSRFPGITSGQGFVATLAEIDAGKEVSWEIVKVTARSGDVLTVVRGCEDTAARPWPSGSLFEHRVTAGIFSDVYVRAARPEITNPGPIYITQQKTFTVVNFDGFSDYAVTAQRGTATISGNIITYTAPNTAGTDLLTVKVNDVWRDIVLSVLPPAVAAPTIESPQEGAEINRTAITIITSAFAVFGGTDTHAQSQYVIRNSSGTIVYDSGPVGPGSLESVTINNANVGMGESYTIEARHKGATLGWSAWAASRAVAITGIFRGARIDNKATILGNADGTPFTINGKQVWIAVLDAAYRGVSIKFGTYGTDTSLPNMSGSWGTMTQGETETAMDARAAAEINDSTFNCNAWMTYTGHTDTQSIKGVPAVKMCRDISLDGTPCDLPTAKVLMRIWQHRDYIDSMDPTAAANTAKKLSNWGFGSATGARVWSSSEGDSGGAVGVASNGAVNYYNKNAQFGVVPVLEIPA